MMWRGGSVVRVNGELKLIQRTRPSVGRRIKALFMTVYKGGV